LSGAERAVNGDALADVLIQFDVFGRRQLEPLVTRLHARVRIASAARGVSLHHELELSGPDVLLETPGEHRARLARVVSGPARCPGRPGLAGTIRYAVARKGRPQHHCECGELER
jgi:hypothetical protein